MPGAQVRRQATEASNTVTLTTPDTGDVMTAGLAYEASALVKVCASSTVYAFPASEPSASALTATVVAGGATAVADATQVNGSGAPLSRRPPEAASAVAVTVTVTSAAGTVVKLMAYTPSCPPPSTTYTGEAPSRTAGCVVSTTRTTTAADGTTAAEANWLSSGLGVTVCRMLWLNVGAGCACSVDGTHTDTATGVLQLAGEKARRDGSTDTESDDGVSVTSTSAPGRDSRRAV